MSAAIVSGVKRSVPADGSGSPKKVGKQESSASQWPAFEEKMKAKSMSQAAIAAFQRNYDGLVSGASTTLSESEIDAVDTLPYLAEMPDLERDSKDLLKKTAVLKLNGGLGTSMGLEKAKSLLKLKDGKTFLDLIAQQVKYTREKSGSCVRFILMNSFSTSEDSTRHLKQDHSDLMAERDVELMQNTSPKVDAATLEPARCAENPSLEWCPPGHGDIYAALLGTGMLERLLTDGIEYLFVSNSDNLGATLDMKLLDYFASSNKGFLMEVAERSAADKKGGHLCKGKADGKLMLRESAQCPKEDEEHFQNVALHKYFNTNNLWIHLPQLQDCFKANNGSIPLPLIKNAKTVDPRDKKSTKVFQLETAMGAAIECFKDSAAVCVPRTRFAPVKTCGDLFLLRSDAYMLTEDSRVVLTRDQAPLVKLDDNYYKMVDQLEELVAVPPSLVNCLSLTVKGEVKFLDGTSFSGHQTVINTSDTCKVLPNGDYQGGEIKL